MIKNPLLPMQERRHRRCGCDPWVRKIQEKEMATHSSILAGNSHGQRNLVGYSPRGHRRVGYDLMTKEQQQHLLLIWEESAWVTYDSDTQDVEIWWGRLKLTHILKTSWTKPSLDRSNSSHHIDMKARNRFSLSGMPLSSGWCIALDQSS